MALLVGHWWQYKSHLAELNKLNNQLALSQQLVKETQTAISSRALEIENLKVQNSDLQKVLKKNKEEVFALTDLAIQWKNKYFEIKDAKQIVLNEAGTQPASLSADCEDCITKTRIKIEFDQTKEDLRIFGFTLTNPAQAQINLEWLKPLMLQLVLTKSDDGSFKVYLDEKDKKQSSLFVPKELSLRVDPSVISKKWYEKINIMASISLGNSLIGITSWGGMIMAGAGYAVTDSVSVGLNVSAIYTGNVYLMYGANVFWTPFLRK